MQDSQDKETSTDEVQTECKRIQNNPGGGKIFRTRLDPYWGGGGGGGGSPSLLHNTYRVIPSGKAAEAWR